MSKTVKGMIIREYQARLDGANDAMLISIRGVKAIDTTKIRRDLAAKKIKVAVIRNALARRAFEGTGLAPLAELLQGANAVAFGGGSVVEVAREIVGLLKQYPGIELKGAVLDGTLYTGDKGVKELSKFPTKAEAIAKVVTLIVSPGRNVLAQIKGPGSTVAGLIKSIETKLEKGETIARLAG